MISIFKIILLIFLIIYLLILCHKFDKFITIYDNLLDYLSTKFDDFDREMWEDE